MLKEKTKDLLDLLEPLKNDSIKVLEINDFDCQNIEIQLKNIDDFFQLVNNERNYKKYVYICKYYFNSEIMIDEEYQEYVPLAEKILSKIENELSHFIMYVIIDNITYSFRSKDSIIVEQQLKKFYDFVTSESTKNIKESENRYIERDKKTNQLINEITPEIINSKEFKLCSNKKLREHFIKSYLIERDKYILGLDLELIADFIYMKLKASDK